MEAKGEALSAREHEHEIVYYGVLNLWDRGEIIGAVDVWRCRLCISLFCEERRYGVLELAPEVGFSEVEREAKWAILVCLLPNSIEWSLVRAKPSGSLVHECPLGGRRELLIGQDWRVMDEGRGEGGEGYGGERVEHRLYLVEDYVNKQCVIRGEGPL